MAALAMGVLAALLLEGHDLLALALGDDFGGHAGAGDQRRAGLDRLAAQQHKNAAGGVLDGTLEEVTKRVLADVGKTIAAQIGNKGTIS